MRAEKLSFLWREGWQQWRGNCFYGKVCFIGNRSLLLPLPLCHSSSRATSNPRTFRLLPSLCFLSGSTLGIHQTVSNLRSLLESPSSSFYSSSTVSLARSSFALFSPSSSSTPSSYAVPFLSIVSFFRSFFFILPSSLLLPRLPARRVQKEVISQLPESKRTESVLSCL